MPVHALPAKEKYPVTTSHALPNSADILNPSSPKSKNPVILAHASVRGVIISTVFHHLPIPVKIPVILFQVSVRGVIISTVFHHSPIPVNTPVIASQVSLNNSMSLSLPTTATMAAVIAPGIPITGAAISNPNPAIPPTSISSQVISKSKSPDTELFNPSITHDIMPPPSPPPNNPFTSASNTLSVPSSFFPITSPFLPPNSAVFKSNFLKLSIKSLIACFVFVSASLKDWKSFLN